jgi:hypothetical protein
MTDRFCPAGKCECGNSIIEHFCKNKSIWRVEDNANCPFPDNQQPVEPKAEMGAVDLNAAIGMAAANAWASGRAEGVRTCVDAVKAIKPICNIASPLILKDEAISIIAALEGVKGE